MVAAASWWSISFGLAVTVVLTRLLPAEAFGAFALTYYVAGLVMLQPKVAVGAAFARHRDDADADLFTYVAIDVALAVASLVPATIALALLPAALRALFAVLALAGVIQGLGNPLTILLEKQLDFSRLAALQVATVTMSYLPAVWLATRGGGAWSLAVQNVSLAFFTVAGLAWLNRSGLARILRCERRFDRQRAKHFTTFGLTAGTAALAAGQAATLDTFLVGSLRGTAALGFYDRGSRTAQWPALLFNAISGRTALYAYARLDGDRTGLVQTATLSAWFIGVAAFPLAVIVFVTAPELIALLYGARWLPSVPYLRILLVASVLRPLWENASALFNGIGKPRIAIGIIAAQVAALVGLGVPLTLLLGPLGAGVASSAAMLLGMVLVHLRLRRELGISLGRALAFPSLAAGVSLLGGLAAAHAAPLAALAPAPRLAVEVVVVVALFATTLIVLQPAAVRERLAIAWRLSRAR
jgi:O-antigen/teichoic acid export membrane protein